MGFNNAKGRESRGVFRPCDLRGRQPRLLSQATTELAFDCTGRRSLKYRVKCPLGPRRRTIFVLGQRVSMSIRSTRFRRCTRVIAPFFLCTDYSVSEHFGNDRFQSPFRYSIQEDRASGLSRLQRSSHGEYSFIKRPLCVKEETIVLEYKKPQIQGSRFSVRPKPDLHGRPAERNFTAKEGILKCNGLYQTAQA